MFSHATSTTLADAIRVVTVMEMALVAGLAVAVAVTYVRTVHNRSGDMIALTSSYIMLATFAIAEITGYYGSPITWRTPIGFIAGALGAYATMNIILNEDYGA